MGDDWGTPTAEPVTKPIQETKPSEKPSEKSSEKLVKSLLQIRRDKEKQFLKVPIRGGKIDQIQKVTLKTVQIGPHKYQTGIHFHDNIPAVQEKLLTRGEAIDILELIWQDIGTLLTQDVPKI